MSADNQFFVGVSNDRIVMLRQVPNRLTKAEALNLAAWLVALADDDAGADGGAFAAVLREVCST